MPRFSLNIFLRSFRYAFAGLRYALLHEQSFRVQTVIAFFVVVLMLSLPLTSMENLVLTLAIASVLVLELLNTVLERFLDALKPRIDYFVAIMKDLMAAAVFVASLAAAIIGLTIFLPYFV